MNKDEELIAGRIAGLLDQGKELPEPVLARLHDSRQRALERQGVRQGVLALPGGLQFNNLPWFSRFALPLLVVMALALVSQQWIETQQDAEQQKLAEIDAAMLISDLPLDAYLDRDFQAWLHSPPQQ